VGATDSAFHPIVHRSPEKKLFRLANNTSVRVARRASIAIAANTAYATQSRCTLLSGETTKMIIEHRTYTLHPGNTAKYFSLYTQQGMSVQLEYLPRPIGYYTTELGTLNQVIHLWAYDDLNDRAQRRALMKQDPRWTAYVEQILPLIQHQESKILVPASFFKPTVATFAIEQEESIA
jgi:hypothetical protein